jgi:hypothetical protein
LDQIRHGCARTTEAVRRAIQDSQASVRVPAARYGVGPTTGQKWKKRRSVADMPMGSEGTVIDRVEQ